MTFPTRHVSVSISRSVPAVYEFASDPANLPKWASGLSRSTTITHSENSWLIDSPMGQVKVRFADRNSLGVIDHEVTLPSGERVYNPLRVVPNGTGSEVTFTIFRRSGESESDFDRDSQTVLRDLQKLKALLET